MQKSIKAFLLPILCFGLAFTTVKTQAQIEFNGKESNNVRIDPNWTLPIGKLGDSFQMKDAITDAKGNTYWYGYFNRGLKLDSISLYPNKNGPQISTQIFLFKISPAGQLLWYLHSPNRSLACQLSLNKSNQLIITGSNRDREFNFVNNKGDTTHLQSSSSRGNYFFVAQIGEDGSVADYKQTKKLGFNYSKAFAVDDDGNYLISTSVDIKIDRGQSYSYSSSYGIFKLSPDLNEIWSIKGTKSGATAVNKIVQSPEGNYLLGGVISPSFTIGDKTISSGRSGVVPLIVAINKQGQLLWAKDSLADGYGGSIGGLAIAANGDIALSINPQSNPPALYLLNSKGNLQWKNKLINKSGGMKINQLHWNNNLLHVVGYGRGAAFESQSVNSYSLQSKGSHDVFMATYSPTGEIKSLKAFGAEGNESTSLSLIAKNQLLVFHDFKRNIIFKKKTLKPTYGIAYLLSAFSIPQLIEMNTAIEEEEEKATAAPLAEASKSCYCSTDEVKSGYSPTLSGMLDYDAFAQHSEWTLGGSDTTYNALFLLRNWFSGDQKAKNYSLALKTRKDIKLLHPTGMFTVNLTPCIPYSNLKKLSFNFNYTHSILRYTPKFDLDDFHHSLRSYFDIVCDRVCQSPKCLLDQYLSQSHFEDSREAIKKLNKTYKLGLKLGTEYSDYWLDKLMEAIRNKKLNVRDIVFEQTFPNHNPQSKEISTEEEEMLISLFYEYLHRYSLQSLHDSYLQPNIDIDFASKNYAVELSTKVFKKWNYEAGNFYTDMEGKPQPSPFLISGYKKNIKYHNRFGVQLPKGDVCFEDAQLADTKIIFRIPDIHVVDLDSKLRIKPSDYTYTKADDFCGLWAAQAQLLIPIGKRNTLVKAYNLAMNNQGVEAQVRFALNPENPKEITLMAGSERKTLSMKQVTKWLLQSGFDQAEIIPSDGNTHVYCAVFKHIN